LNFFETLIVQVLINASLIAGATWLIKKYLEKRIEHDFMRKLEKVKHDYARELEQLKAGLALDNTELSKLFDFRVQVYQEFGDALYRCRNLLRDVIESEEQGEISHAILQRYNEFCSQVNRIKELLFRARVLMGDGVFQPVHNFKILAVKYALLLDSFFESSKNVSETQLEDIIDFAALNDLYEKALHSLQYDVGTRNE